MSIADALQPITVHGSNISYFTGKLEMYFRVKGIPYRFESMTARSFEKEIPRHTGVVQMPALELGDGRWLTDTTPIIDWFEQHYPAPNITPVAAHLRFFSRLLEDYADEWLWRPAMHFRWWDDEGAMFASRHLANELGRDQAAPGWLTRWMLRRRQRGGYTEGDGVREHNREAVEKIYTDNLAALEQALSSRPFLLGDKPSLADVAFTGPMFRHFSQDPRPAIIMREQAPGVYEWVARMWNYRPVGPRGTFLADIPDDWDFWLEDIGRTYLPYLNANARAVAEGMTHFDVEVGGARYEQAHVSPYRAWCLEQLRAEYAAIPERLQPRVRERLEAHGCWEPLWGIEHLDSGVNRGVDIPFRTNAKMLV